MSQDNNATRWAGIRAVSSYLPSRSLTNAELAKDVGWTAEQILEKTGIEERRIAADGECVSDMVTAAVSGLLRKNGLDSRAPEFLILCTQTPDFVLPATACIVQEKAGLGEHCAAFDISLGCSGYVYALGIANGLIRSGMFRRGIVATGDVYSKYIHPRDRSVRTLFGDAATATWITEAESPGIEAVSLGTDGKGARNLIIPAGGTRLPRSPLTSVTSVDSSGNERSQENLFMNGSEIFTFSVKRVPALINSFLADNSMTLEQIDWVVFHQANRFMLDHLRLKTGVPAEKMLSFISKVGNTVSSTIPLVIEHAIEEKRIQSGQRVLLVGFGVGYSWGAASLKWN